MPNVGPTNRQEAAGFAVNGKGYIGTGDDFSSGNNYKDMWEFDPVLNQWTQIEDFKGTARRYLQAVELGEYAYAGLGTSGTNFKDFWIFDQKLSLIEKALDDFDFKIYPNPASETIQFNLPEETNGSEDKMTFVIYSLMGAEVTKQEIVQQSSVIDINHIKPGVYIYSLNYDNVRLKSGQLLISRNE